MKLVTDIGRSVQSAAASWAEFSVDTILTYLARVCSKWELDKSLLITGSLFGEEVGLNNDFFHMFTQFVPDAAQERSYTELVKVNSLIFPSLYHVS